MVMQATVWEGLPFIILALICVFAFAFMFVTRVCSCMCGQVRLCSLLGPALSNCARASMSVSLLAT